MARWSLVRRRLVIFSLLAALGLGSPLVVAGASADDTIPRPNHDPFYRYDGAKPLSKIAPGTPLATRDVTLAITQNGTPLPAEQILYRTTDATGKAVPSVTTVILPATGTANPRLVAYLSFYDALSNKCSPSYTLRGGDPGEPNHELTDIEQGLVHTARAQGFIVTVPDFEDETLDYVAGTESGMSSLDGLRATIAALKLEAATPVGLIGYSGGSIAADWASELQPSYAPKVNLVGTAMGGIPVNLRHNLRYVNGTPEWSNTIPAAMIGISRSFHIDLTPYLSSWGRKVVAKVSHQCIGEFSGEFPNLTIEHMVKDRYETIDNVPVFRRITNKLRMGSVAGHPRDPFYMAWGNQDGTGDGVMVAKDQAALAAEYCADGLAVTSEEFQGLDHNNAAVAFFTQAFPWLTSRFAGVPAPSTC